MLKKGWAYNMNPYVKEFLHRGLMFSGLGPIVAGIVYFSIELSGTKLNLSGTDVLLAIISTYILAFVQAGSSVFNMIEKWGKAKSLLCQMSSIYAVYMGAYLINRWIPFDYRIILIFTISFVTCYLIIWFTVFFIMKKNTKKLNEKLLEQQE
jgi:hypothetical protein